MTTLVGPVSAVIPDFSADQIEGDAPLTVTFPDLSYNAPTPWNWSFGDGKTSGLQNLSHEYTVAGTYTVTLTATNSTGVIALPDQMNPPTDPDGDGLFEDMNGNGVKDLNDVVLLFREMVE